MAELGSFESIMLKKLTHSGEFFGKVMPILDKKFFPDIGSQELFGLIQNYYLEYRSIPTLTELVSAVKDLSNSEIRAEVIKALHAINATEEVQNIEFMCDQTVGWVKDAMYMEALQLGSDGLMKKNDDMKLAAKRIMEEMAKVNIDSDLGLDFDDIDAMIEYYSARNMGILTQHKELNKRLGAGFLPGTLSIILAASGIGKSLMMTDIISGIIKGKKNILLVSLEMADKEIMKRVHANAMDLPINSLLDLNKTEGELAKLDRPIVTKDMIISAHKRLKLSGDCGRLFIKDYPAGSFSPLMLEQLIESYKIEKNIEFDIVFVDYVGLMKSDLVSPAAGLYSYIKSIGEETRAVARKVHVPIVSASQLNRGATNNVDGADNSNVSDSMGTVMTADFMLFLLQNDEMKERKEIICKVTKNRFTGFTDSWMMNVDYEHMRFNDMLVQGQSDVGEIAEILDMNHGAKVQDDFGIITAEKKEAADEFVKQELREIVHEDVQKIMEADKNLSDEKKDPFNTDLDDLYKDLGI